MISLRQILRSSVLALGVLLLPAPIIAGSHKPPAPKDATTYPAVDIHPQELVAVAAEPFETKDKTTFFRVDYLKYGFMPIRIIVTNNGERPISLKDARIDFISANGDKIPAAEPEDIERRTTNIGNTGRTIPLPFPLPPIHEKPKSDEKKINQDFDEFEYGALAVEPHTTRAGFLFYDVRGLGSDPLKGAKLELRELRNSDGKELFYFEIPFDKYLGASTAQ
ncbi:hypothetical protein [Acidipila rosea]|uniref:Uncharacterized protein n=1 Tax=Acidipila rosea TaxID=768535 RepID=A0A4R1L1G2_9BACT|nr:hypothetical protein [Acidipila rosea]TCK71775.1 hypothetical protein C7378_3065 [Acidipila rosea]